MPINPFNYTIDYFDSVNLGPITDSNFLNYLVSHNLQNIEPAIANTLGITNPVQAGRGIEYDVSQSSFNIVDTPDVTTVSQTPSVYNNFTNPLDDNLAKNPSLAELASWYPNYYGVFDQEFNDYKTQYSVGATLQLGFVGNVEKWFQDGLTVNRNDEIISNEKKTNKYGPESLVSYDSDVQEVLVKANTGLIQYNPGIQNDFRDEIFNRTLGVGIIPFSTIGSGINYKPDGENISELDRIARERRGFEVKERIKINFIDETIGSVNLNPLSLLTGNDLFQKDFAITRPARFIGRAAQFLSDLGGFSLPTSILQDFDFNLSIFNKDGSLSNQADPNILNEIDVKSSLLNRTGKATREVLFDNISNNKYGPNFEEDYEVKNDGTYLTPFPDTPLESVTGDKYGGFYGKYEPIGIVNKSISTDAGLGPEKAINEYTINDNEKPDTTYLGTPSEIKARSANYGTVNEKFDWRIRRGDNSRFDNKFTKGILQYTQNLVNKSKLGDAAGYIGYFDSIGKVGAINEIGYHQSGEVSGGSITSAPERPSRGNTTRNYDFESGKGGDYYCRSWSSRKKYHTWNDLIRKSGNWWRGQESNKNMTMNWGEGSKGVPKIAFDEGDTDILILKTLKSGTQGAAIPYMFSIENLAWKDAPQYVELPECEKGSNGGRIMWFPPYDINFSENNSVNWESTSFIGRGENIYTYNNSERSGTLDFTVIVDHPAVLNQIRKDFSSKISSDEQYHSFFAGCDIGTLRSLVDKQTTQTETTVAQPNLTTETKPCDVTKPPFNEIKIYFENSRNASTNVGRVVDLDLYEVVYPNISLDGVNQGEWPNNASLYPCGPASANTYNYLNLETVSQNKINELVKFLISEDGKNYKIKIVAYTSVDSPTSTYNQELATARATSTKEYLYNKLIGLETEPPPLYGNPSYPSYPTEKDLVNNPDRWDVKGEANPDSQNLTGSVAYGNPCDNLNSNDPNSRTSKEARYAIITLEENKAIQNNLLQGITKDNKKDAIDKFQNERNDLVNQFAKEFITECEYFEAIKRDQPFVYTSLQEKIKGFHPAFHSMTPEGLNSRLTFLNQCTRQGPQILDSTKPQNMVFGRPPICVLRIGDFYNTKIVVDSVNISYDPLQWDLNPEGIGVQPMLAKVTMSFKFIGGSSLGGPIKQLQNAVSYNFYANTGVYQPWKYTEKIIDQKQRFIYGAFMSPGDAETAYGNINSSLGVVQDVSVKQNLESVNTTSTSTDATTSSEVVQKTEENMPTNTNGSTSPTNFSTDMERLTMSAEVFAGEVQLTFGRKESSDYLSLDNDYTVTSVSIIALNDDSNSIRNIPIGETILASNLITKIGIFPPSPINIINETYTVYVYLSSSAGVDGVNFMDYKNAALKI